MITYGKTVFATYTYKRDRLVDDAWKKANNDFNRYIQRLRRLHKDGVQYLRTVEAHDDGYPHFHAILRFHSVLTITNGKYFDRELYRRWKHLWRSGLSDYQVPKSKRTPIAYIIKYVTKGSSVNVWKKYYSSANSVAVRPEITSTTKHTTLSSSVTPVSPLLMTCKRHKIKQVTWSRKFFKELHTK